MSHERSWTNVERREEWSQPKGMCLYPSLWPIPGPWHYEPDKLQWIDNITGMDCLAVRNRLGTWCGYVAVTEGHSLFQISPFGSHFPDNIYAHGGVNYSDFCQEDAPPGEGICHIPEPGHPDRVWWFGFDCGHGGDYWPNYPDMGELNNFMKPEWYKTLPYVKNECRYLAKQLKELG